MNIGVVKTLVADNVSDELLAEAGRRATADEVDFASEIIDHELAREASHRAEIEARLAELTN